MTRKSRKNQRRVIASLLTGVFMIQQTMTLTVVASEISGVTSGGHGTFNISPTNKVGNIGFRQYEKFNLDAGDIANLNYADIATFVNMVDNKININGIVNTMRNGNFYNGKAVFVSPNGMVVGASGVLNVGSLGVYTPSTASYNNLVKNQTEANLNSIANGVNNAEITINGKVFSAGDIDLKGSQVTVGKNAGMMAGVNNNKMAAITSSEQATALFNNLVNTDNLNTGNQFASTQDGQIVIRSTSGTDIQGTVKNFATGANSQTKIMNINNATNGIKVSGEISNANGTLQLNNNEGDMNISGTLRNNGTTRIFNTIGQADGNNSQLTISGNIDTQGTLDITNTGLRGTDISGTVNHIGTSNVTNGYAQNAVNNTAGLDISGTFNTTGDATFTNYSSGIDGMTISGDINTTGKATYTNNPEMLRVKMALWI